MQRIVLTGLLFFIFMGTACDKGEPVEYSSPEKGMEYFPLEEGSEWTYRMDSMRYDLNSNVEVVIDTSRSYMKYSLVSIEDSGQGMRAEIMREYRKSDSSDWNYYDLIEYELNEEEFVVKEGNISIQKSVFPLTSNRQWNPTTYTDPTIEVFILGEPVEMFKYWEGGVHHIDSTGTVLGQNGQSLLKTVMADFSSLIELRKVVEVYAENIGLVSREIWILDTQCAQLGGDPLLCNGMPWEEIANRGFILKQGLISYR